MNDPAPLAAADIDVRLYRPGDEGGILRLFRAVFHHEMTLDHWRWKYLGQDGRRVYAAVAVHPRDGIVAHYGTTPLRLIHRGRTIRGLVGGDLMVHPDYRALVLFGGLFGPVASLISPAGAKDGFTFGYGFPSRRALGLLERLGLNEGAEEAVAAERPVRWHAGLARWAWRLAPMDWSDPRIDALWRSVSRRLELAVIRDRSYLEWRYKRHPVHAYQLLGLTRRGSRTLAGLAVVRDMGETLYVMDLVFGGSPLALLAKLDNVAVTLGKRALRLWIAPRYHAPLVRAGFRLEPTGLVIPSSTHPDCLQKEEITGRFYYTLGDYDVF